MIVIGFILFAFGTFDGFGDFGQTHELVGYWGDAAFVVSGLILIIVGMLRWKPRIF